MNHLSGQKNLSWLEDRIRETEARITADKARLAALESQGINTGQACRQLAITTEYLHILTVRKSLLLYKLHGLNESSH